MQVFLFRVFLFPDLKPFFPCAANVFDPLFTKLLCVIVVAKRSLSHLLEVQFTQTNLLRN